MSALPQGANIVDLAAPSARCPVAVLKTTPLAQIDPTRADYATFGQRPDDLVICVSGLCGHPGLNFTPNAWKQTCAIGQYQSSCQNDTAPVERLLWAIISPYSELPNSTYICGGERSMKKQTEAHIDEIVAMCDGDLRGALKALMLVNEHLESQLERLHATGDLDENNVRRMGSLH
jgi:hypothetical protein